MAEASLFADLPFPDDLPEFPHSVDDAFALEDFNLDDLDIDFDLDLFPTDDVQHPSPPPPLATSSSSAGSGSPGGGSSSSGAGVDGGLKNDESSESSSRSASAGDGGKPADGKDGEDKRRARLVRNRESAHLSRQRKKQYVDELEGKVKAMQATIADLSARISCVTAENAALKHQLASAGGAGAPPPLPMYPGLYPLPPPWIHPAYAMRGSQVPLVPIPRLKTRQPAHTEAEPPSKKAKKTKKVASVSLLGLLLLMMLCGCLIPAANRMYYGTVHSGEGVVVHGQSHHGRILAVDGPRNSVSSQGRIDTKPQQQQNASETLPALLYIPRNGKHVKINGNLVIKSVVASEKASSSRIPRSDGRSSVNQGNEETTGLAIPAGRVAAQMGSVESAKRLVANKLIALPPGDGSIYSREDDELLPQWFSEAMSGKNAAKKTTCSS